MEQFKMLFAELYDLAEFLELDFVAAYSVSDGSGTVYLTGDCPVFAGAAAIINSDSASIDALEETANALNAYILERREVVTH